MGKDIKLNSYEWCDMVFEKKNQKYGAYRLRQSSSKRHIYAFVVVLIIVILIAVIPIIVGAVKRALPHPQMKMEDSVTLTNLAKKLPPKAPVVPPKVEPPKLKRATIKYVPPKIVKKEEADSSAFTTVTKVNAAPKLAVGAFNNKNGLMNPNAEMPKSLMNQNDLQGTGKKQTPFVSVEQMPTFPGGEEELMKFIQKHVNYPQSAQETGIQGRVMIKFVVDPKGYVTDITVLKKVDPACDAEAVRVIKSLPRWNPGKQNGKAVPVYCILPVTFKLQ